jgi:hypothetical protein
MCGVAPACWQVMGQVDEDAAGSRLDRARDSRVLPVAILFGVGFIASAGA